MNKLNKLVVQSGALLALLVTTSKAQSTVAQPDRPTFTDTTQTVSKGQVQLEGGYNSFRSSGAKVQDYGQALLRVGLTSKLELRVAANSYEVNHIGNTKTSGFQDSTVGLKYVIYNSITTTLLKPNLALEVNSSVSDGSHPFDSAFWQPQDKLLASWNTSTTTTVGAGLQYARLQTVSSRQSQFAESAVVRHNLTNNISDFAEVYNINPSYLGASTFGQVGLAYKLHPNLQLDSHIGKSINGTNINFYGIGAAYSF